MTVNRGEHLYTSPNFEEIIKDTIRFFNGTPVYELPPEKFHGTGVYALYCIASEGVYAPFHQINRIAFQLPIYIGKAVPRGWRQARNPVRSATNSYELHQRLREHGRSITQGSGIELKDFRCRFIILEGSESALIGTVEAALIRTYTPLWNSVVDGFGNHDPGKGRYKQAKSDWDVQHSGRIWADRCLGISTNPSVINNKIADYLAKVNRNDN